MANTSHGEIVPYHVLPQRKVDSSMLLTLSSIEATHCNTDNTYSSESEGLSSQFVGTAMEVGDPMTFKIPNEDTKRITIHSTVPSRDKF